MAFESLNIEAWLYSTLSGDSTLQTLLAKAADNVMNYQQGVYAHIAPTMDPISKASPVLPYIVFQRISNYSNDVNALCGNTALSYPSYRVLVWNGNSKSMGLGTIKEIADRVDTLISNAIVTSYTPAFNCLRMNTDNIINVSDDGKIYYAAVLEYYFVNRF